MLLKPSIPKTVSLRCLRMLSPVQLDGELQGRTIEIQNIAARRMLPAKAGAVDLGIP